MLEDDAPQRRAPRRRRAHGRFRRLGHAGQLRLADRGAPRGAPRLRASSTSRTCWWWTSRARGARTSCAARSPTTSTSSQVPGKALYSCMLNDVRRRDRRPHRLLLPRRLLPPGGQRRARPRRTSPGSSACAARLDVAGAPSRPRATSRCSRSRGRARARRFWQAFPDDARGAPSRSRRSTPALAERHDGGAHRLHRRGRLRGRVPPTAAEACGTQLVAAGARPAGLGARDTLRLEAGMNLYGQDMDEGVSPLDAGLAWTVDLKAARDFVGREALEKKGQAPRVPRPAAHRQGRRAARPPARASPTTARARSPAARSRPRSSQSIALARLPLGVKPGDDGAGAGARQAARRARGEAALRAQRQDLSSDLETRMNIPKDLRYTESHEWLKRESDGTRQRGHHRPRPGAAGRHRVRRGAEAGPQGLRGRVRGRGRVGEGRLRHLRAARGRGRRRQRRARRPRPRRSTPTPTARGCSASSPTTRATSTSCSTPPPTRNPPMPDTHVPKPDAEAAAARPGRARGPRRLPAPPHRPGRGGRARRCSACWATARSTR